MMYLAMNASELENLARFLGDLERHESDYGPEMVGTFSVRVPSHDFGAAVQFNRCSDGRYEVFLSRDAPETGYIVNRSEDEQ